MIPLVDMPQESGGLKVVVGRVLQREKEIRLEVLQLDSQVGDLQVGVLHDPQLVDGVDVGLGGVVVIERVPLQVRSRIDRHLAPDEFGADLAFSSL